MGAGADAMSQEYANMLKREAAITTRARAHGWYLGVSSNESSVWVKRDSSSVDANDQDAVEAALDADDEDYRRWASEQGTESREA